MNPVTAIVVLGVAAVGLLSAVTGSGQKKDVKFKYVPGGAKQDAEPLPETPANVRQQRFPTKLENAIGLRTMIATLPAQAGMFSEIVTDSLFENWSGVCFNKTSLIRNARKEVFDMIRQNGGDWKLRGVPSWGIAGDDRTLQAMAMESGSVIAALAVNSLARCAIPNAAKRQAVREVIQLRAAEKIIQWLGPAMPKG